MMDETVKCRHCGLKLNGQPYFMGGSAYHPRTGERCKVNHYGGYVCSRECDYRASLDLERTMPGHTGAQVRLGSFAQSSFDANWEQG